MARSTAASDTGAVETDALARIREGLELFSRGDYEASVMKLSPEIEWVTTEAVPDGGIYRGRAAVVAWWIALGERWDDFRIEPERWVAGADVVLMLGTLVARGVESGVPVESSWDQVWHVRDGQAVRCENFIDRERAWTASGLEQDES